MNPMIDAPKDGTEIIIAMQLKAKVFWCDDLNRWVLSRTLSMESVREEDILGWVSKASIIAELLQKRCDVIRAIHNLRRICEGLFCLGCKAQGADMAKKCCRNSDCDAGWFGIDCDEVAKALSMTRQFQMCIDNEKPVALTIKKPATSSQSISKDH